MDKAMSPQTKLALRRFALRWLRKLVDVADDRLHAAEVTLRNNLSAGGTSQTDKPQPEEAVRDNRSLGVVSQRPSAESFLEWEARRSGIAVTIKKHHRGHVRRRRQSAADFDFQIIRKREEFVQ